MCRILAYANAIWQYLRRSRQFQNAINSAKAGEVFGVRQLAAAFAREAGFALLRRRQAAALQGFSKV
jgi:hypothetical protein